MKFIRYIIASIFLLFAVIQINDPDPLLWIFIYGYVAIAFLLKGEKPYNFRIIYIGLSVYIIGIMVLLPDFIVWIESGIPSITGSMKAENPEVERVREFSGLVLCFLALRFLLYYKKRNKQKIA